MKRIRLKFMVVPEELEKRGYVPNRIKIKFINPEKVFVLGILGESGRLLMKAGVPFWFEGKQARWMIAEKIAKEVK